jgi:hypothetical protein
VRLDDNFMNCGACGNECSAVQVCRAGDCVANVVGDGGGTDGGDLDGGAGTSGSGGSGGTGGITLPPDASFPGCGLGETACSGACVTPNDDPSNCGACGVVCGLGQFCVDGMCLNVCDPPFTFCPIAARCEDLSDDPDNCGSCGNVCISGICAAGVCQDAVPGHLIVVGHDYTAANATMRQLAQRSVFLAAGAPVPALTYQGTASDATVARINAVIESSIERQWAPVALANAAQLSLFLDNAVPKFGVFVIYPQAGESDQNLLQKLRQDWLNALAGFLKRGGVVVLFEHNPSDVNGGVRNSGTHQILGCRNASGDCTALFSATAVRTVLSATLMVDRSDQIAIGVPEAYVGANNTMRFSGVTSAGNSVVTDPTSGDPVIVHRAVSAASAP